MQSRLTESMRAVLLAVAAALVLAACGGGGGDPGACSGSEQTCKKPST